MCRLFHVPVVTLHNISEYAGRREMILKERKKQNLFTEIPLYVPASKGAENCVGNGSFLLPVC